MVDRFAQFTGAILTLYRYINKIKELEMAQWGLRGSHVMCLYYLGQYEEGLTAAQLTSLCKEDKAAISRTVAQLTQQQLIRRSPSDTGNSYRAALCLTDQGKMLVKTINQKIEDILACSSQGISDQQRETLYRSFQVILNNLEQYVKQREESASPKACTGQSRKEGIEE